jgi:L-cysteine desulfidase
MKRKTEEEEQEAKKTKFEKITKVSVSGHSNIKFTNKVIESDDGIILKVEGNHAMIESDEKTIVEI